MGVKKQRKLESVDSVSPGLDRISSLPDDLLRLILSFLPTKFARATKILSTRWKHVSDSMADIDLDDSLFLHPRLWSILPQEQRCAATIKKFTDFICRVVYTLRIMNSTLSVNRFSLRCRTKYKYFYNNVISEVVSRNVRVLEVIVPFYEYERLIYQVFRSETLEVFRLFSSCEIRLPLSSGVKLINLKQLHLRYIKFTGAGSIRRLLSGCPVLEDLRLHDCELRDIRRFEVCVPSLKNLVATYCEGEHCFVLDTPKLKNILYSTLGDRGGRCLVKDVSSIVHADIGWGLTAEKDIMEIIYQEDEYLVSYGEDGIKFINAMENATSLCLQGPSLTTLYISRCSSLSTFWNVAQLELGACYVTRLWWSYPALLACFPNLETLIFFQGIMSNENDGRRGFTYREAKVEPGCYCRSLKNIKVDDFHGMEWELTVVEYFMKFGQVLKEITIGTNVCQVSPFGFKKQGRPTYQEGTPKWVLPACERLSVATRRSKTCQVVLTWNERHEICKRIFVSRNNSTGIRPPSRE